jgi:hypothetical protein
MTIDVKQADGSLKKVSRTLYRSHLGPMITLSVSGVPVLGWNNRVAYTLRDANLENDRLINQFAQWNQAEPIHTVLNQVAPGLPVLKGNTAACDWDNDSDAPAKGIFGGKNLPTTNGPPVATAQACDALRKWDGKANVESVGAHVWREFWRRAAANPAGLPVGVPPQLPFTWTTAFNAADPVETPRGFNGNNPAFTLALGDAIAAFR